MHIIIENMTQFHPKVSKTIYIQVVFPAVSVQFLKLFGDENVQNSEKTN